MTQLESKNPATGAIVGSVPLTPVADIPAIVDEARAALGPWAALSVEERLLVLGRAAEGLSARKEQLGRLLTEEMGKPLPEAVGEVGYAVSCFRKELVELAEAFAPEVRESDSVRSTIYRDPFGVAACIAPWNFPVLMPHQQILPALAAGNAVIFKPSEKTPLVGQAYADALLEVLPEGVLTVIHGGEAQGKALVAADVDLVVFTGSRAAGKHILGEASKGLKRVILELGGKDPMIVLESADIPRAGKFAARNSFRNAGQVCISTERIYVAEAVREAFLEALIDAAEKMKVGDGLAEGTAVGPMVDEAQKEHVRAQLGRAIEAGAVVAYRGDKDDGNFVSPIVLTGLRDDMEIVREETFGPVACVLAFEDVDDAVRRANDTPFGLGAIVFGEQGAARAVGRRLGAGMVGINQGLSGAGGTPWVGAGESGYGYHSGIDGHRQFAQTRVLSEPKP